LGLALFGLTVLSASRFIIPAVTLAAVFAYLVRPIQLFLRRRFGQRWGLAVLLVYVGAIILGFLAFIVLAPAVISSFVSLAEALRDLLRDLTQSLESTLTSLQERDFAIEGVETLVGNIIDPMLAALDREPVVRVSLGDRFDLSAAANVIGGVASLGWKFAIFLLTAIWLSLDADKFIDRFLGGLPSAYRPEVTTLATRLLKGMDNYVRGEAVLMLTMGTIVAIGNLILGTPGAIILGVISGFMEIIPGIGPAIALIPAVTVALLEGSTRLPVDNVTFAIIVLIFYLGVQVMENHLLIPRVMGEAEEMHPLLIILGIAVGGAVFGLIGAVLTVPVLAMLREILRYALRKLQGLPPFPEEEEKEEKEREADRRIWRREFGHRLASRIHSYRQQGDEWSEATADDPQEQERPDHG
jgi:predicted PurR-regulated permease PerM